MEKESDVIKVEVVDLRAIMAVLVKRKLVIILGTLLAVLTGAVISFFILVPLYEAQVLLRVNYPVKDLTARNIEDSLEEMVNILSRLPHMTMQTHAGQLKSQVVMQRAADRLNLGAQDQKGLPKITDVTVVENSNLIILKVRHHEPVLAKDIANAVSDEYIEFISEMSQKEIQRSINFLQEQYALLREELFVFLNQLAQLNLNDEIQLPESQAQREYWEAEVNNLRKTMDLFAQRIVETRIAGSINFGQASVLVVSPAVTPTVPVKPNKGLNIVVAFVLGLISSVSLVFLQEHLDNKIKTPEDVEEYLDLPVLGVLPKIAGGLSAINEEHFWADEKEQENQILFSGGGSVDE